MREGELAMVIMMESKKSLAEVCAAIEPAAQKHRFGVLGVRNLKETLAQKGIEFDRDCFVFEVCNPVQAKKVLLAKMEISTALPCRISVYTEGSRVKIATIRPTDMLAGYQVPELQGVAAEVEATMIEIMRDAAE
jgi:uncharacterized protein (DUF302 family)